MATAPSSTERPPPSTVARALILAACLGLFVAGSVVVKARMDSWDQRAADSQEAEAATPSATGPADDPAADTSAATTSPSSASSATSEPSTTTVPTTLPAMNPTGIFVTTPGTGQVHGTGTMHTYRTEVEEGAGMDPLTFAAAVDSILADPRGWTATDGVSFQRVEDQSASFTVTLATPATTDQICLPLRTNGIFSCREGTRAVINLRRWMEGTTDLPLPVDEYRAAVINHEVGHVLGKGHVGCGGPGLAAPVMMQQSKGLDGCRANPWPTLDGT